RSPKAKLSSAILIKQSALSKRLPCISRLAGDHIEYKQKIPDYILTKINPLKRRNVESQSNNSSEQNGEDMVQMFSVFQTRMEKKVRDRQEKLENDCNKTMQQMRKEMKVNKYKNQYQEYKEEKYSILERLKSENLKLLQNYKSIVNELARVEMSQMKEFQIFEKKYNSFIEEIEAIQNE
ncbi:4705_t:CDS:2, partial [Entrophospora sp. SA101]